MPAAVAHVRGKMIAGLLLVLPLLITLLLLRLLFGIIHENVTPAVMVLLTASGRSEPSFTMERVVAPIVGLVLTALFIYLLGLLAGNLIGRRLWALAESLILRVPVVKGIYGAARQLLDALSVTSKGGFSKVVVVEYPRPGLWTVGFLTNETGRRIAGPSGSIDVVAVFLPTSPNPTSGWVVLVPRGELNVLDMTIEDGMKLVVSGGIVLPEPPRAPAEPLDSNRAGAARS